MPADPPGGMGEPDESTSTAAELKPGTDGTTGTSAPLSERIRALERAVSESDDPPQPVPDVTTVATDLDALTIQVEAVEESVADIEARQQAVEAYVDRIEHVNDVVERRADAALAAVDRLESTGRTFQTDSAPAASTPATGASDAEPGQPSPHVSDATGHAGHHERDQPESGSESSDEDSSVLTRILGW